MAADNLDTIIDELLTHLSSLKFGPPIKYVYNPLTYARKPYSQYCRRYGSAPKEAIFLGMNPGPWGMAQTGVPFGDVGSVKGWLDIEDEVTPPPVEHPQRPIRGFQCPRSEVSGQRLWGWARNRFGSPKKIFRRFWVGNYCPFVFLEESGRNRTPDKLKKSERMALFDACDDALRQTVKLLQPRYLIGIGNFAFQRAASALADVDVRIGRVTHPSPANPKANKGWADIIEREMKELDLLP